MKKSSSIQLKAIFLLIVFFSNIIVGFACSVGAHMGFYHNHHENNQSKAKHIHSEIHHHNDLNSHHDANVHQDSQKQGKDNCCKDEIVKLEKTDKIIPGYVYNYIYQPVYILTLPVFYNFDIQTVAKQHLKTRYFVRSYHPPISDIRIAVQSFQI